MAPDFIRNLRLVAATVLLSVWGYAHLVATPVLGKSILPLLLALLIAPGRHWSAWRGATWGLAIMLVLVATTLLYVGGTRETLEAVTHSPYFVVPIWLLGCIGLVRNATTAERLAAADVGPADASATWAGAPPSVPAPKQS